MAHKAKFVSTITIVVSAILVVLLCTAAGASGIGQWTATGGPWSERGRASLIVVDEATPGTAYAVVEASGLHTLYRTTDSAQNWTFVHAFRETIGSLATDDTVLYMGAMGVPAGQPAIWRSTDSGATWTPVYTAISATDVHALVFADSTDHVYAALGTDSGGAVLRTTTGTAWSTLLTNDGMFEAIAVDPDDPTRLFAAGNDADNLAEIYRSTNAGADWDLVLTHAEEKFEQFLVIHPENTDIVFAKTRRDFCCPPPSPNLWRSRDGGDAGTWHSLVIPGDPENPYDSDPPLVGLYNAVFAAPDSIYGLDSRSYQTLNASADVPVWTATEPVLPEQFIASGAVDDRVQSVAEHPLIYVGFWFEGVYTSTDSLETVHMANDGFYNLLEPRSITLDPQDKDILYVVTNQDGFRSTDGGANWTSMNLATVYGHPMYPLSFSVRPGYPNEVLMGVDDSSGNGEDEHTFRSIHHSDDGGVTWTPVYSNTTTAFTEASYGVVFDPSDSSRAYAISSPMWPAAPLETTVLRSSDAGLTWTPVLEWTEGESDLEYFGMWPGMSVLRVDPEGIVYLGGRTGGWEGIPWSTGGRVEPDVPAMAALYRSTDHGDSWEVAYEDGDSFIRDLTFDPQNPDHVYMIKEYDLLKSDDRGATWETILTSDAPLYAVLHDPGIPGRLYLGMQGPVIMMSYDSGANWVELKNWAGALSAPQVMSLAAGGDLPERTIYAGLDGVWEYVLSGMSDTITPAEGGQISAGTSEGITTTIDVPAGAVAEDTTLLYMPAVAPAEWFDSSGLRFAGQAFTMGAYVGGNPVQGFTFSAPVTVTMHYNEADIVGMKEESLVLQLWEGGEWIDAATTCTPASAYVRNTAENWLAVPICHLSYYALAAEPPYTMYLPIVMRQH